MSGANSRLVEYFLVVGVNSKTNGGGERERDSTPTPSTSPLSVITEGEDGKVVVPSL